MTEVDRGNDIYDPKRRATALRVIMCSKSRWQPSIRREHALARAASQRGVNVDFIEAPSDIREVRVLGAKTFVSLMGSRSVSAPGVPDGVRVTARTVLVPGHRSIMAAAFDSVGLRIAIAKTIQNGILPEAVVVNSPWNWNATAGHATRRVLDIADDWRALLPNSSRRIESLYRRIDKEADAVIVASDALAGLFNRNVYHIPNAMNQHLSSAPVRPAPRSRRLIYLGSLSERFDSPLMQAVLTKLPGWSLDLYGSCVYAGMGSEPSRELQALLSRDSVTWHGAVEGQAMVNALDGADIFVLPNRRDLSRGQDSMKLYDYASRGRPIVATGVAAQTPGLHLVETAEQFANAVKTAYRSPMKEFTLQTDWAATNTWNDRIDPWLAIVMGHEGDSVR